MVNCNLTAITPAHYTVDVRTELGAFKLLFRKSICVCVCVFEFAFGYIFHPYWDSKGSYVCVCVCVC